MSGLHFKWLAKTIVQLQTSSPLTFPAVLFSPLTSCSHKFRHSWQFTFRNYIDETQPRSCGQVVCSPLATRTPIFHLGEWKSDLAGYGMSFVLRWNLWKVDQNLCWGENWVYLKQDFQTLSVISFWMISRFGKASGVWTNPKVNFIYWCRASVSARQEMRVLCPKSLFHRWGKSRRWDRKSERKQGWVICDELVYSLVWPPHAAQRKVYQEEKTKRESG